MPALIRSASRTSHPPGAEIGGDGGGIERGLHELATAFGMGRILPEFFVFVRILTQVEELALLCVTTFRSSSRETP